jgi:hypothetical protein
VWLGILNGCVGTERKRAVTGDLAKDGPNRFRATRDERQPRMRIPLPSASTWSQPLLPGEREH